MADAQEFEAELTEDKLEPLLAIYDSLEGKEANDAHQLPPSDLDLFSQLPLSFPWAEIRPRMDCFPACMARALRQRILLLRRLGRPLPSVPCCTSGILRGPFSHPSGGRQAGSAHAPSALAAGAAFWTAALGTAGHG
ncbi:unnamed protein product [Effrenium voratum]|nr:unnamed protein product [Effrenium voratum]